MLAPESACPTPSSGGRVQPVEDKEDSATEGVHLTTAQVQDVCLESAPPLPTEKILAPLVQNLQLRLRKMNAMDNVGTSLPIMELTHARIVLKITLTPPVKM